MELIARWLRPAVDKGADLEARSGMLEASMLAGATMLGAGLGLMHGIGNIAGGLAHAAHGLVLTRLLQPVLEFNRPAIAPHKLQRIQPFIEQIVPLAEKKLVEFNVAPVRLAKEDLPLLAHHAARNVNSKTNPRSFQETDILQLAQNSFQLISSTIPNE
jgi:alcohol dehydrogenase